MFYGFLAEGKSLDNLIRLVQVFFLGWSLPGLIGLWVCRLGRDVWIVAFSLGLTSFLGGACCMGWVASERGTALSFYLAAGTPMLLGIGTCWWAWRASKRPGPPV